MTRTDRSPRIVPDVNWLILLGAVVAAIAVTWIADRLGWVDLSNKSTKSGGSGGVVTMMDEVFAPTRQELATEFERQTSLPVEAPVAADDDHDLLSGRVLIRVPVAAAQRGPAQAGTHDRRY
jgi:hypothetical protein